MNEPLPLGPMPTRDYDRGSDWHRRPQSLHEQIAEDVARGVLSGEFLPGQRVGEVSLAERYGVSRGPVRDAIRELEKSGLVEIFPRRGAFIAQIDSSAICDMFNVVASVMSLAARYCALFADDAGQAEIDTRLADLDALADMADCDPREFALASGRIGAALGRNCKSTFISASLADAFDQTFWALIFREHEIDYLTEGRRRQVARDWSEIIEKIRAAEDTEAERLARALIYDNRDETLKRLRIPNSTKPDGRRLLRDPVSSEAP